MLDQLIRANIVNGFLLVNVFADLIKRLFYSLVNGHEMADHIFIHICIVPERCSRQVVQVGR